MGKFTDILGQELFPGALIVKPSTETRNYMDYGVVKSVGQFAFTVDILGASQTFLPESVGVALVEELYHSASDNGFLVINPQILQRSNVESPRYWKKVLLNLMLDTLRPIRQPNE